MSVTVIVSLKVEDFDKWYAAFSSTSGKREEAGILAKGHRNIDDPNNAVAIGTAPVSYTHLTLPTSDLV